MEILGPKSVTQSSRCLIVILKMKITIFDIKIWLTMYVSVASSIHHLYIQQKTQWKVNLIMNNRFANYTISLEYQAAKTNKNTTDFMQSGRIFIKVKVATRIYWHWSIPWASCQIRKLAHAPGMPGTFIPPTRVSRDASFEFLRNMT